MTKQERAIQLTAEELDAMDIGTLGAVAQALGTSGKTYDGRKGVIGRIVHMQKVHKAAQR